MRVAAMLPIALMVQTAGQIRAWQGRRFLGFLLMIFLLLGIVYFVKRIFLTK